MSQRSLWNKVSKGDRNAFAKCFDQYWESLYHAAFWRVCDEELAKDLVQEVFITLWDKRADIVITDNLPGYGVYQCNEWVGICRRRSRTRAAH